LSDGFADPLRHLRTDAQTSGGLLISCAENEAEGIVASIWEAATLQHRLLATRQWVPRALRYRKGDYRIGVPAHSRICSAS
jgi:hypothetical protein